MQEKVSKIVLFAIFCSIFSDTFSDNLVSRALDLARNIQSPGNSGGRNSGQQSDSKPGPKVVIPSTNVTYDMNNTELKELNIQLGDYSETTANTELIFISKPRGWSDEKIISDLSFIPEGTTEFTIIVKAYDESGKSLESLKDLRRAINNFKFEETYKIFVVDENGYQIGSTIDLPIDIALNLTNMLYSGRFNWSVGVNYAAVDTSEQISYPISLTLKNIERWNPGTGISLQSLIGKNLTDFKKDLGIKGDSILLSGSNISDDDFMPLFNINMPTENDKARYAFVDNPWRVSSRSIVASIEVSDAEWNQIFLQIKSGGYMSLVAFDNKYNYIAEPWKLTPSNYSLFIFDNKGNPVDAVNGNGQKITPIRFSADMYAKNINKAGPVPSISKPTASKPIEFGGLNSTNITNITTYPFVLKFWDN